MEPPNLALMVEFAGNKLTVATPSAAGGGSPCPLYGRQMAVEAADVAPVLQWLEEVVLLVGEADLHQARLFAAEVSSLLFAVNKLVETRKLRELKEGEDGGRGPISIDLCDSGVKRDIAERSKLKADVTRAIADLKHALVLCAMRLVDLGDHTTNVIAATMVERANGFVREMGW